MAAKCGNMHCGAVETMISEDKISIKPCILIPFIVDILNGVCQYLDFSEIVLITVAHVEQIVQVSCSSFFQFSSKNGDILENSIDG